MKRRALALLAALLLVSAAPAQVTFAFNYLDAGTGFNDGTLGATRRGALESAASTLASYFTGYSSRTVTITVNVSENDGADALASAGSPFFVVDNSFQRNLVMQMIQDNNNNGQTSLGSMTWDFGYSWDYDDSVAGGSFDFKSVAMHELIHTLGFSSYINGSGVGGANGTTWSWYDQFLTNASGTPLINPTTKTYQGGTILSDAVPTVGQPGDVYFSGTAAMAANGGQRVHIYSPATFESGSSLGHIDTDFFGTNNYIMTHAVAPGQSVRTLSALELAILTDLGYSVSAIPEPSTYAAILGCLALVVVYRRRAA